MFYSLLFPHTPTPQRSTLSLHDALPILTGMVNTVIWGSDNVGTAVDGNLSNIKAATIILDGTTLGGGKGARLDSGHRCSSYAVFCGGQHTLGALVSDKADVPHYADISSP